MRATNGEEGVRRMTSTAFKNKFLEKYFLIKNYRREREFIDLTQGNKLVQEYTTPFERLSQFSLHMVNTEEKGIRKCNQGLILAIRRFAIGYINKLFETFVILAFDLEGDARTIWKPFDFRPPKRGNSQSMP